MTISPLRAVRTFATLLVLLCVCVAGCGHREGGSTGTPGAQPQVITADGSSTVFPVTEAVAEEFQKANAGTRVTVGSSGTGGGFQKFCRNETDISDASRPIKPEEADACAKAGVAYIELPIGYDGIAIVVNPKNTWVDTLTVAELKKMWEPAAQGKVTHWNQIRSTWPNREIRLFGPGTDSGTFDYFTEAIVGKSKASRGDYTSSEDDNVLVQGVSGDQNALGYFGLAYYEENQGKLKVVPIDDQKDDNGKGPITPSVETVGNGTYSPLSRPIFIYVKTKALERPEVQKFADFYLTNMTKLVREVGYIPLKDAESTLTRQRFQQKKTGSMFHGSSLGGTATLEERLKQ